MDMAMAISSAALSHRRHKYLIRVTEDNVLLLLSTSAIPHFLDPCPKSYHFHQSYPIKRLKRLGDQRHEGTIQPEDSESASWQCLLFQKAGRIYFVEWWNVKTNPRKSKTASRRMFDELMAAFNFMQMIGLNLRPQDESAGSLYESSSCGAEEFL